MVSMACPVLESNAACGGGHCCLPVDAGGDSGAGGVGGSTFQCGSSSCVVGQSFCYSYTPGTAGASGGRSCTGLPSACASDPSCACVCPASTGGGCMYGGSFCSCAGSGGALTVSCFGV
jgi:hypothetical protein